MGDYLVEIDGSNDIGEIELEIRFEEQSPSTFIKSSLSFHEQRFTNIAAFHEIGFDDTPKEFKLVPASLAAPEGFTKYWTGTMLISGSNALVSAYRKDL
jgi:hypothetical protein